MRLIIIIIIIIIITIIIIIIIIIIIVIIVFIIIILICWKLGLVKLMYEKFKLPSTKVILVILKGLQ